MDRQMNCENIAIQNSSEKEQITITQDCENETTVIYVNDGPIGLSAYELAVINGYTGTLEEWLASSNNPLWKSSDW